MKVTFIYPDFFQYADGSFMPEGRIYLGIAYLSAVLKEAGHETSLIHVVEPPEREWLVERVKAEAAGPRRVLQHHPHVPPRGANGRAGCARRLGVPAVCGGVHPTIAPGRGRQTRRASTSPAVGEAEETLVELCGALEAGREPSRVSRALARQR